MTESPQRSQHFCGTLRNPHPTHELAHCERKEEQCPQHENQEESELGV